MEYANLERKITRLLDENTAKLERRLTDLEAPSSIGTSYVGVVNYLPNSHPEWSTLAYGTAGTTPATAGDTNRESYNWYYQTAADTSLQTSTPLLGTGHSGYAGLNADAPVWDLVNGLFHIGSESTQYDIACPLPTDFVFPGQRFYVYFEASLADGTVIQPDDLQVYCGFWDNTAGQEKWIEGDDFTPTVAVQGVAGTRTLEYKIFAETDSGTQILSDTVTVTTAPTTLDASNHVRLYFDGAAGFIRYLVYRKDGSNYYQVADIRNSIDLQFFDIAETGSTVVPVDGFPVLSSQRPQAYAKTSELDALTSSAFAAHTLTIQVPTTYNRGNTTAGNQWFRFGLDELMGAGDARGIAIRRISVSEGYGSWTRSPRDMQAASSPTSTATGAPGTGNTTINPPPPGTGNPTCVTLDTIVTKIHSEIVDGKRTEVLKDVAIEEIEKGDILVCGTNALIVQATHTGTVEFIYEIETENELTLKCSESHRLITSRFDRTGKAVKFLNEGDYVLTEKNGVEQVRIVRKTLILKRTVVKSIKLPSPHFFTTNKIVSHNRKLEIEPIV